MIGPPLRPGTGRAGRSAHRRDCRLAITLFA